MSDSVQTDLPEDLPEDWMDAFSIDAQVARLVAVGPKIDNTLTIRKPYRFKQ